MSTTTISKACCTRAPITVRGGYNYTPKGTYVNYGDMKTYVTGPSSTHGILMIYDVFGLYLQTIRGADILSTGYPSSPDKGGEYKVFMPDFFGDHAADLAGYPAKLPAQIEGNKAFFAGPGNPVGNLRRTEILMKNIMEAHPEITSWAVVGFCWGAKLAALLSREGSMFKAAAQCHPSLITQEDSGLVRVPMCILDSLDELDEEIDPYVASLKEVSPESYHETFGDMVHGWMTSRADFEDLHKFEEYLRGYRIVREFFAKHI